MRKIILALAALSVSIMPATPAFARHGDNTGSVILGVVGGTALGLGIGALSRPRVATPVYQPQYQAQYQQPYASQYPSNDQYQQQAYVPREPQFAPPPHGVRCLMWNGRGYVPFAC